jgi:hypothetical protein
MHMTPLNISRSRYLSAILLLIGTAGVLSVVCLPIFWGAQALMSLGLVAYTWHAIQRYALLQHSESWLGLRQDSQQQIVAWRGRTADQIKQYPIRLHPDSVVCHFFILLRFQIAGEQRWHSLLVMPDACQAEVMREWVVGLTWGLAGRLRQAELAQQTTPPSA